MSLRKLLKNEDNQQTKYQITINFLGIYKDTEKFNKTLKT